MPGGKDLTAGRTQVRFTGPDGMRVAWLSQNPEGKLAYTGTMVETPGRYNFQQASIYRLKLSSIRGRPGLEIYPTLEVVPCNPKTAAFLAHSAVPVEFTAEDFKEVAEGKFLVKVIYLPDPQFQELAATGTDEIISTRLEPGCDPILEAQRRGCILLVIRMGNVDQEAPNTPPLDGPAPNAAETSMVPPGMVPPGMVPPGMSPAPSATAPVMTSPAVVPYLGNIPSSPVVPPSLGPTSSNSGKAMVPVQPAGAAQSLPEMPQQPTSTAVAPPAPQAANPLPPLPPNKQ
jgi:hypothetical protein